MPIARSDISLALGQIILLLQFPPPPTSRMSTASNSLYKKSQETLDGITGRVLLALKVRPRSFRDDATRDQWATAIMAEVVRF